MDQPLSSVPDAIDGEQAASAAALERVARARSDETQSKFGAEEEQQRTQRDEGGIPRRSDRTLLEVDKEVPSLEDQATILRIHVKHGHMPLQAMFRTFKDAGV